MKAKLIKAYHRSGMIIKELFSKWKSYSFVYAVHSTLWWIGGYAHLYKLTRWAAHKKEIYIFKYINDNYKDIILRHGISSNIEQQTNEFPVWVFWAQGFENAPELVRMCYANLRKTYPNVREITMNNFRDYVDIPDYIIKNLEAKNITYTNFSDILRCSLLRSWGGVWVDSTCWIANPMPERLKGCAFYSVKDFRDGSKANWCAWVLGTNIINAKIFSFAEDIFFEHFKTHKTIIDTYFIDFIFQFALTVFPDVAKAMKNLPYNSENRNDMHFMLNKPYNINEYNKLTSERWIFKLSYKTPWKRTDSNGNLTFYGKFLEDNGL